MFLADLIFSSMCWQEKGDEIVELERVNLAQTDFLPELQRVNSAKTAKCTELEAQLSRQCELNESLEKNGEGRLCGHYHRYSLTL